MIKSNDHNICATCVRYKLLHRWWIFDRPGLSPSNKIEDTFIFASWLANLQKRLARYGDCVGPLRASIAHSTRTSNLSYAQKSFSALNKEK